MMDTYHVLIIGSGPAGLFAAMELERLGLEKIAVIDRHPYPAGGLLNDGKLNFDYRVGIDLAELKIDRDSADRLIKEIRTIFVGFSKCRQVTFIDRQGKNRVSGKYRGRTRRPVHRARTMALGNR